MKTLAYLLSAALLVSGFVFAGDVPLPKPQKTGGMPLFEAIDARGSAGQRDFPSGKLDWNDFSTILWAASGLNRDGNKWTVPMGMGKPPYCDIYVTVDSGVYRYDWKNHALTRVSAKDVRALIPAQPFAKSAPAAIYVVTNGAALSAIPNPAWGKEFGVLLAGAMSQNVYLACGGIGVGARLLYSIDRDVARDELKIASGDEALFVMILGKK